MITLIRRMSEISSPNHKTFKNFGHKRQPIAGVTTLWHGFLTVAFIGFCINWENVAKFFVGENEELFKTFGNEDE